METIEDIGCKFKVYRNSKNPKIISISLWKANQAYIFNLSRSILWWATNGKFLFPDWNIRFYIDYSIFRRKFKEDIDWREITDSVKRHDNIELWFYECSWGKEPEAVGHRNTFGSLVRFHAFVDKEVEIALCKNIELLSTPKDARLIWDWYYSGKKFYTVYDPAYECNYGDLELCEKLRFLDKSMILATFGVRGGLGSSFFPHLNKLIETSPKILNYKYGVDELLLTSFCKPQMTFDNTYILPRTVSNQIWPSESINKNYKPVYDLIKKWFDMYNIQYPQYEYGILGAIGTLTEHSPLRTTKLFKYLEKKLNPKDPELLKYYFTKMTHFYFEMFKSNEIFRLPEDAFHFFYVAENEKEAKILAYLSLRCVIFEDLDWIGYSIKKKGGLDIEPKIPVITESEIKRETDIILRVLKRERKPIPEDPILREKVIKNILGRYKTEKDIYEKNKKIFRKNLKNILLFSDKDYK